MNWIVILIFLLAAFLLLGFLITQLNDGPRKKELKRKAAHAEELSQTLSKVRDMAVDNRYNDPGYDLIIHEIDQKEKRA